MKARVINDGEIHILQFIYESDKPQNLLETNIPRLADFLASYIESFMDDVSEMEEHIGNLGMVFLSDNFNNASSLILEILQDLQPKWIYYKIFTTLEIDANEKAEYITTEPGMTVPSKYHDLIFAAIVAIMQSKMLDNQDFEVKSNVADLVQNMKNDISDFIKNYEHAIHRTDIQIN